MNVKRITSLMTVLVLMAAILCGCGSNGGSENTASTTGSTAAPETTVVPETTAAPTETDDGKVTYTVTVVDENNNPVEGVILQFCDAENCKLPVGTDANGVVSVSYEASEYHVLVNEIPEGYICQETEYYFDGTSELTIVLTAAAE